MVFIIEFIVNVRVLINLSKTWNIKVITNNGNIDSHNVWIVFHDLLKILVVNVIEYLDVINVRVIEYVTVLCIRVRNNLVSNVFFKFFVVVYFNVVINFKVNLESNYIVVVNKNVNTNLNVKDGILDFLDLFIKCFDNCLNCFSI